MSIFKRPKQEVKKQRNAFDMSQRQLFTSSVGQCLPVYYDLLQPGDKINIDSALLTRTQTLSSNPMTRVTEHIDYFFVPYRRIWSNWNQYYTQMWNDINSSKLFPSTQVEIPSINLATLISSVPHVDVSSWQIGDPYPIDSTNSDQFGILKEHNAKRLLDLLGFGINTFGNLYNNPGTFMINPALLCAYHAINRDFYRLTDREIPSITLSNMDDYYNNPPSSDILSIYYRPWKRDFYTNIETSPLFGGYQTPNSPLTMPQGLLSSNTGSLINGNTYTDPNTAEIPGTTTNIDNTSTHDVRYLNMDRIRQSAALERLAQLQRYNEKFWNAQMSALFGMEVPDNYDHCVYLGSHHSNLQFSDVVGTATTSDSVLGEIVGKGIGLPQSQKPIKFETKQHGFLMAIYSATPESDYMALGLDRLHTYTSRNCFYQSVFDNLGPQPKFAYQSNMTGNSTLNASVLGWEYRWSELKSKPDLVHGAFSSSLRHWVTHRSAQTMGITYPNFCIDPSYLDSVMLVSFINAITYTSSEVAEVVRKRFNAYINDAFGRDPLLHQLYFKAFKISAMSEFALPSHNSVML